MEVRWQRAGGASLVALAALALAPAAHAAGLGVTSISSLPAGARSGNLSGVVSNDTDHAAVAKVNVRAMKRRGTGGALLGQTSVSVAAHATKTFLVDVRVPSLKKGTYYIAACAPKGGADKGALGCATGLVDDQVGEVAGVVAVRGSAGVVVAAGVGEAVAAAADGVDVDAVKAR